MGGGGIPDAGRRRMSFGAAPDDYDRFRPGYPEAALRWMLAGAALPVRRLVDVGAGTGKFTVLAARLVPEVVAVEPDPRMRAVLADRVPGVRVVAGSAEGTGLDDACADAVVLAQAYHWADPERAPRELARVLRRGGVLGAVWNLRDDTVPWVAELHALAGGEDRTTTALAADALAPALPVGLFGPRSRATFRHGTGLDADALVGLVSSWSHVRLSPDRERILDRVRALATGHPDLRGRTRFTLQLVTVAYRAVRVG